MLQKIKHFQRKYDLFENKTCSKIKLVRKNKNTLKITTDRRLNILRAHQGLPLTTNVHLYAINFMNMPIWMKTRLQLQSI